MVECKEFTKEVGENLDSSWKTKWRFVLHFVICACCRSYLSQLKKVNEKLKKYYSKKKISVSSIQMKNLEKQIVEKILKK